MSTSTQRRSNSHALYRRSRSAWMCLSVTLCRPALTPLSLAQGRARGTSLGCSTLASPRQGSVFFFNQVTRSWPERPSAHEFSKELHTKGGRKSKVYGSKKICRDTLVQFFAESSTESTD